MNFEQLLIDTITFFPVWLIAAGITLFALFFWWRWSSKVKGTTKSLANLTKQVTLRQEEGVDALRDILENTSDPAVKALLQETHDSLFQMPGELGYEPFSLKTYQEIWQPKVLLAKRVNLALFEAMPNLLIGAGLMFTFIYLAAALGSASNALGSDSAEAIRGLLENAGGKFITSIAGIFCSLVWNFRSKAVLEALDDEVEALSIAFRKIAKDTGAEAAVSMQMSLLGELLTENREQVGQLKRFETDFALAIGKAIGDKLNPSVDALGKELSWAIRELSKNLSQMNQDALADMMKAFVEQMSLTQQAETQKFMSSLGTLAEKLEGVVPSIVEAAGTAGTAIGASLTAAGEEIRLVVSAAMSELQVAAQTLEGAILLTKGSVTDMGDTLDRASAAGDAGAQRLEGVLARLGDSTTSMDSAMKGAGEMISTLDLTVGKLSTLGDDLSEGVEAQRSVVRVVQDVLPRLQQDMQKVFAELETAGRQAEKSMAEANRYLTGTTERLDKTLGGFNEGIDNYTTRISKLHSQLDSHLGLAVTKLDGTMNNLSETLDEFIESMPAKVN